MSFNNYSELRCEIRSACLLPLGHSNILNVLLKLNMACSSYNNNQKCIHCVKSVHGWCTGRTLKMNFNAKEHALSCRMWMHLAETREKKRNGAETATADVFPVSGAILHPHGGADKTVAGVRIEGWKMAVLKTGGKRCSRNCELRCQVLKLFPQKMSATL